MRPLISTHRGHDRKRNDRRQHDTCTQNEIDDHTGDAHVTTPRCSMIEHASANCRHAASCAIAASRAQAKHGSRLHTSACQHPCTTSSAHANKRPARARRHDSATARERDSAAMTCTRAYGFGLRALLCTVRGDADRPETCQRRNKRLSGKAHHPKLARGHHDRQLS